MQIPTTISPTGGRCPPTNAPVAVRSPEDHATGLVQHSPFRRVKGLEVKHIFMPRYQDFIRHALRRGYANPDWLTLARNQVYVGMTRARDTLCLGSVSAD